MKLVVDSNVLLSGLLWHGAPHRLLESARDGAVTLVTSPILFAELADVISRTKFSIALAHGRTTPGHILAEMRALLEWVDPSPLSQPVCRDPDDDAVLAVALAARAEMIVTGDRDLLVLGAFQGVPIVTPAAALQRLPSTPV